MKVKLTAEQKKAQKAEMIKARALTGSSREEFMAKTIGDVYDVELPIPEVINSIADVRKAEVGEHVYYLAPTTIDKKVNTITSDCEVEQVRVTPGTRTEVSWVDLVSEEVYVCLQEWLKADHDVLQFNADAIQEALDRQEIYSILNLADAGAVSESNTYTLDSGKSKFDYPKLVDMARSIAPYGRELVLITGGNITTDIMLMNYDADKNQAVSIFDVVQKHIPVEELKVTIDSVEKTVISPDVALLVAVADAKKNRSIIMARRKTGSLSAQADTEVVDADKERIVISNGNGVNIADKRKVAKAFFGVEEYAALFLQPTFFASFYDGYKAALMFCCSFLKCA